MTFSSPYVQAGRRCSVAGFEAVTRRINRPASAVGREALPVGQDVEIGAQGALRLDVPFTVDDGGWRATGRLVPHGPRLVRYARVDIYLAPWSDDACELRLVPRSRHIHQWGGRRKRRYWRLAHAAADHVAPVLAAGE